jgi:hypothetical protein
MSLGSGIRDPRSGIRNKPIPGSGINLFRIPDPGSRGQKGPDPGSGSATLQKRQMKVKHRTMTKFYGLYIWGGYRYRQPVADAVI